MPSFSRQPQRRSRRLPGYDYSSSGMYFLTLCTAGKALLFGRIVRGEMVENECGQIVRSYWEELPSRVEHIRTDVFVVMPNHIHGVIAIFDNSVKSPS